MSSVDYARVFVKDITSNTTLTSMFDLEKTWNYGWLRTPLSTATDTALYIQAAPQSNLTFTRITQEMINTTVTVVIPKDFSIITGTSARMVPIPIKGLQYIKVELKTTITDVTIPFYVVVCD